MNSKLVLDKNQIKSTNRLNIIQSMNKYIVVIALIAVIVIFSFLTPHFLSIKNFYAIGLTLSVVGIICIGQTLCILIRGFDLSVGQVAAFSGILIAYTTRAGVPYLLAFLISMVFGIAAGLINGMLIAKLKINALITTLATMQIYLGGVYIISGGYSITVPKPEFSFIGTTRILGIPLPIIILVALYLIFYVILKYTVIGRYIYCMGGNPEAAKVSGINTQKLEILVYTLSSILAAFAGIILSSRMGAAQTTAGGTYSMDSIAAVVLGGTALSGGKGNVLGSLVGIAIVGILQNGLIMINMPIYYQFVATGLVLIVAVLMQSLNYIRSKR